MTGQHSKLIMQVNKALSLLSKKVYTDVLSEINPNDDYSLFNILLQCKNELSKTDDRDLIKIINQVEKQLD